MRRVALLYNATPHSALGYTPFFTLVGLYSVVLGFARVILPIGDFWRATYLKEIWTGFQDEHIFRNSEETLGEKELEVGNLIVFELPEAERKKLDRCSGCTQYNPHWPSPHRIKELRDNVVRVNII